MKPPEPLFRDAVIEHKRNRLHGDVRLDLPIGTWIFTGLLAAIGAAFVIFMVTGTYVRSETVAGWLTPDKGVIRVTVAETGTVDKVDVEEGDVVVEGEQLFTISRDTGLLDGKAASSRIYQQLETERREVARRLELLSERFRSERQKLDLRQAGLDAEKAHLETQIALQKERVEVAISHLEKIRPLVDKGTIAKREFVQRTEALLAQKVELSRLTGLLVTNHNNVRELSRQVEALPTDEAIQHSQLKERLAALDQRLTDARRRGSVTVPAPVSGRVAALIAQPGSSIASGEMMVSILPKGGKLQVELFVPSRAAGFLSTGQEVRIRYDAFPYQKFGLGNARVSKISRTVLHPRDKPQGSPEVSEPFFRVVAQLEQDQILSAGKAIPLQAGMKLTADIVLEKRHIWELILRPLLMGITT